MESNTLWHIDPAQSVIRPHILPRPGPNECLVRARFSMVSQGTERLVCRGGIPREAYEPMRVPYMQGEFSFPLTYGYSMSGEVVDGPREWLGERVHGLHPHQDLMIIRSSDLTVIPGDVPMDRAVLASNLETAVNGVWDADLQIGERVAVVGFGLIGALTAWLVKPVPGIDLRVIETDPVRQEMARSLGFHVDGPEADEDADRFDLVFHSSATAQGLQWAIDHARNEGRIVELSWFGTSEVRLHLGSGFHFGRKRILSSQVSRISPPMATSWDLPRRKDLVFRLLTDPALDVYLGQKIPFEKAPEFFHDLRTDGVSSLNTILCYP